MSKQDPVDQAQEISEQLSESSLVSRESSEDYRDRLRTVIDALQNDIKASEECES